MASSKLCKGTFHHRPHQKKERVYVDALIDAGYLPSSRPSDSDFGIYDRDFDLSNKVLPPIRVLLSRNKPVFLYPHGSRPPVYYDGVYTPYQVSCYLAISQGHVDIMRKIGYEIPMEVCGWTFCKIKKFQPRPLRKILFAPIHPLGNGYLHKVDKQANRQAFERLSKYCREAHVELHVRHFGSVHDNGIPYNPDTTYTKAVLDGSTHDIDQSDLVVAHQTFLTLAVARGVPAIAMSEDMIPHCGVPPVRFVKNFNLYENDLRFPLDINNSDDVAGLITRAATTDEDIQDWRDRMIGKPFDSKRFISTIEKYL
jgi:hypothetical protein